MLYLIKCFFSIYWCDHMVFVFPFVYVIYYVYWFPNVVPSLHPWDKSHLIMVYYVFNILLDAVCQYFVDFFFFLDLPHCFRWSQTLEDFLRKRYIGGKYFLDLKCQNTFVFYPASPGYGIHYHCYSWSFIWDLFFFLLSWNFYYLPNVLNINNSGEIFIFCICAGFSVGHFNLDAHVSQVQKMLL